MNIENWLGFFRIILYMGTGLVAIGTIMVSILSPKVDKIKEQKIDELLQGNKQLQSSIGQYQNDLQSKEQKIQELEKAQKEIEKVAKPRNLSQEQKTKLLSSLSFKSDFPIRFVSRLSDQESLNFAEELAVLFRQAGWNVIQTNSTFLDNIEGDVAIAVTEDNQREIASKIANILNSVGIVCKPENIREGSIGSVQPNTIHIIVGAKLKKQ